MLDEVI
jgi:Ubiquitin carboxyl-terminal hydrolase